jgi:arsenate reductase
MAEAGVDISNGTSNTVDELPESDFDYVITLCGHANETCPFFPGKVKRMHAGFDDPPALAKDAKSEEEAMVHYRRVRDEIRQFVTSLPDNLQEQ